MGGTLREEEGLVLGEKQDEFDYIGQTLNRDAVREYTHTAKFRECVKVGGGGAV